MVLDSNSLTITCNLHCFHHDAWRYGSFFSHHSCPLSSSWFIFLLFSSLQMLIFLLLLQFSGFVYLYVQTLFNQVPFSFLRRINHNLIFFWRRRNIYWISLYLFSRACRGLFRCHSRVIFVSKPMFATNHWNPTMTSLNSHQHPCTEVASTLFGSVQLPLYWWIWKGFWEPQTAHWFASSRKICWESFPCFEWTRFACAK